MRALTVRVNRKPRRVVQSGAVLAIGSDSSMQANSSDYDGGDLVIFDRGNGELQHLVLEGERKAPSGFEKFNRLHRDSGWQSHHHFLRANRVDRPQPTMLR